ncbi:hypothetical protein RN001_006297 [Aquatica leii]|uniref:Uncharacterized protein n=1 Tax=Aquatica leii TaxID=1421715 RepID=A0AAN7QKW7_9COLE|nr:hypothetical protein RN001_006297 [Aquatica leii]
MTCVLRHLNSEVYVTSGIYLERLPNISFYQTTTQILFRFTKPKPLYERLNMKFCTDNEKLCQSLNLDLDYFDNINYHVESKLTNENERILIDDGEIFDFQFATRNHVKRMFTNTYEISILLKRINERENIIIREGKYQSSLNKCIRNTTCNEKNAIDLMLLDYEQRYDWTRSFVNMCQNKKLPLDIVTMSMLNLALELVKQEAFKYDYVIALTTVSQYYTMPLIECIISPDLGIVGIHIPLLKKELSGLAMKKMNIPSLTIAITNTHNQWTILIPKCDPFKEELCLVTETQIAETLTLLCIKQVLTGGTIKQFIAVCPVSCRETGKQEQFVTYIGNQKFSVTHPKKTLVLKCQEETYNLTIDPNIGSLWIDVPCGCTFQDDENITDYPTYRCIDKSITYGQRHLLPAVWSQFPGLTLTPWDSALPQFDNLHNCLNKNWIEENVKSSSTPVITYFVVINFLLIVSVIFTIAYLYVKLKKKFVYYERHKLNPADKKTFEISSVKFSKAKTTYTRPKDRPLPEPIQEETEYLDPNEYNENEDDENELSLHDDFDDDVEAHVWIPEVEPSGFEEHDKDPDSNDFVLVQFNAKKEIVFYVGKVVQTGNLKN